PPNPPLRARPLPTGPPGPSSFLPTPPTADPEAICESSEGIARYIGLQHQATITGAEVLGIHFEGPFISSIRRGVHPPEWIKLPSAEWLGRFVSAAAGNARLITLAPELLRAIPCIDAARKAGMVVGMGHTHATYEQARATPAR